MPDSRKIGLAQRLSRISGNPWFAYGAILLLQCKVMFRIWEYRDLTPGDASEYFQKMFSILDHARIDVAWSPIYTLVLAGLYRILDDPFWASMVMQVGVALAMSLLILALLRVLLPHHLALAIAAWWAVLPINFDTVYNVHLFSAIFPVMLFLVAAVKQDIYGRGIVLGGLLLSGVLVRTEYLALFALWLIFTILYELRGPKKQRRRAPMRTYLTGYGLPLLLVILLCGGFFARSTPQYPEVVDYLSTKTTLYVCQNYAYSRKQQGDIWQGDPWTECREVVQRDFGQPAVTFAEAFNLNPGKILEHLWWNLKLVPSGTQLALFNHYAGAINPDFMRATRADWVWLPFIAVLALSLWGGIRRFVVEPIKQKRSVNHGQTWLLMFCAAGAVFGIMLMVRPRPSYMFPYTLFLMALSGLGLNQLLAALKLEKPVKMLIPIALAVLIILVPPYYSTDYISHFGGKGQGWRQIYETLAPHIDRGVAEAPSVILIPAGNYQSLCNYLGTACLTEPEPSKLASSTRPTGEGKAYLLYHEDMIWQFVPSSASRDRRAGGYFELRCFAVKGTQMTCSDGFIDLASGLMNDGTTNIPLRAALFIKNGEISERIDYRAETGYYLQVLHDQGRIGLVLVADQQLYRADFNQHYLLGNFDRRSFQQVYKDFPRIRLFELVENGTVDPD